MFRSAPPTVGGISLDVRFKNESLCLGWDVDCCPSHLRVALPFRPERFLLAETQTDV